MNALRAVYHLARADFFERIRRYSFLVVLGATLVPCYYVHTGNISLVVGGYRGTLNSAWLGAVMTLTATILLGLVGFYLINNCIARDEQTGVGQILAATPISKPEYILGKLLSNFAVLSLIVCILILAAVPLQLLAGEDKHIHLLPLVTPFLFLAFPLMALISATAILFETIPWLRGALGNCLYFILFLTVLAGGFEKVVPDLTGMTLFYPSLHQAEQQLPPLQKGDFGFNIGPEIRPRGFDWQGVDWTLAMFHDRLYWLGTTLAMCLLATLIFNRFDRSRLRLRVARPKRAPPQADAAESAAPLSPSFRALPPVKVRFNFEGLFVAELRLLLKGMPWWWYLGLLGGIIAGFTLEGNEYRHALWFAWIWPLGVWSKMGCREARFQTGELVFSAPNPVLRQLPATWLAGLTVALVAAAGVLLRMAAAGDWTGVEKVIVGAAFIASLALALGAASGTSKLFEAFYTGIWYIGVLNHAQALDYTQLSVTGNQSATWLAASACAVTIALVGRLARLRR